MTWEIRQGDALSLLKEMPDGIVQTVVTSPPYWGLRDYGTAEWEGGNEGCVHRVGNQVMDNKADGAIVAGVRPGVDASTCLSCGARRIDSQLGLEPTPDQYVQNLVEVFREVRRVLRDDGTVWLNLGDSYASSPASGGSHSSGLNAKRDESGALAADNKSQGITPQDRRWVRPFGLKPKDLCGIPWSVAKALQEPYYAGQIKRERDRVWLAATIDGEGTICGFRHERKDDGRIRTGVHTFITNSDQRLLDEAHRIWPASRSEHLRPGAGHLGERETWRWIAHGAKEKALLMRELYPHLIVKRQQALLAYNLLLFQIDAKRLGRSAVGDEVRAKRDRLTECLSAANGDRDFDVPNWCVEPPTLHERGWFLRSDIIWSKLPEPNPMPESVTDRPTRSHEYIFLLSKSARYFFDQEAVREAWSPSSVPGGGVERGLFESGNQTHNNMPQTLGNGSSGDPVAGRNIRSVWNIATQPFPGSHFAVFPTKLVEPCILAGSSPKACGECGAPWERVVERVKHPERDMEEQRRRAAISTGRLDGHVPGPEGMVDEIRTTGWQPICPCGDERDTKPCLILDPFAGSGTVGVVALRHNRSFIGLELNPSYCEMARNRIRDDAPLLNHGLEVAA